MRAKQTNARHADWQHNTIGRKERRPGSEKLSRDTQNVTDQTNPHETKRGKDTSAQHRRLALHCSRQFFLARASERMLREMKRRQKNVQQPPPPIVVPQVPLRAFPWSMNNKTEEHHEPRIVRLFIMLPLSHLPQHPPDVPTKYWTVVCCATYNHTTHETPRMSRSWQLTTITPDQTMRMYVPSFAPLPFCWKENRLGTSSDPTHVSAPSRPRASRFLLNLPSSSL